MFSVSVVITTATTFSTYAVDGHILMDFLTGVERGKAEQVRVKLHLYGLGGSDC